MKLSTATNLQSTVFIFSLRIILILICMLCSLILLAQNKSAQISGKLLNLNQEPVAYCTVALFDYDSILIQGAITDINGDFIIQNIKAGTYNLMSTNIENETYAMPNLKLSEREMKDIGLVNLQVANDRMDEVLVTGKREILEVHPDKIVYNVANSVNASGRNGLEVMRNAPGVMIDPDNNIILQGKSVVRIFINGRPSRLSGSDLTTLLQSMQSDNIKAIEVITNPSAKYEAEGNGGIINIRLKNNINLGYDGNFNYSSSMGRSLARAMALPSIMAKVSLGFPPMSLVSIMFLP